MARYIDANKLTDKLEELQFNAPVMTPVMKIYNVIELVEDQPTADVVEVKHGHWEIVEEEAFWIQNMEESLETGLPTQVKLPVCSHCKSKFGKIAFDFQYCPYCGAKMDERTILKQVIK